MLTVDFKIRTDLMREAKKESKKTNCFTYLHRFLRHTFVAIPEQCSIVKKENTNTQSIIL